MAVENPQSYLDSASSLIKALKAPADPPQPSWPTKIDIALEAWKTKDLYLPRKAEVLRDWVLETLTRPQTKSTPFNAILEPKYYDLLRVTWPDTPQTSPAPLSLLSFFFNTLTKHGSSEDRLLESASQTFELLYRNQRQVKVDAWTEVWTSCVGCLASGHSVSSTGTGQRLESLRALVDVVVNLFRPEELVGDAQVKRITTQLCESLPALVKAIQLYPDVSALRQYRFFLPVPILKEHEPLQPILTSLSSISPDSIGFTAKFFLPELLRTFIDQLQKNKYQVFAQPSSSKKSFDAFVSDKLRMAVQSGFKSILDYVDRASRLPTVSRLDVWESRNRLWSEISQWGGYLESDEAWGILLQIQADKAKEALQGEGSPQDVKDHQKIIELLDILERLDHARTDVDVDVVAWCLAAPSHCHVEAERLISSVLRYHQLTFSLQTFFDLIDAAFKSLFPDDLDIEVIRQVYHLVTAGSLQSSSLQLAIRSAVSGLSNSSMRADILHTLVSDQSTGQSEWDESTAKRKRKAGDSAASAAGLALTTRLVVFLLPSGVTWEDETVYDEDIERLLSRLVSIAASNEEPIPKKTKKSRKSGVIVPESTWTRDVVLAARLRLIRSLETINREWQGRHPRAEEMLGRLEDSSASIEIRTEIMFALSQSYLVDTAAWYDPDDDGPHRFLDVWLHALRSADVDADRSASSFSRIAWELLEREGLFVFNSYATLSQRNELLEAIGTRMTTSSTDRILELAGIGEIWELHGIRDAFVRGLRDTLDANTVSHGFLGILSQCPMVVLPRDLRESLTKHLSSKLLGSKPDSGDLIPVMEWLARIARDQDTVRWIDVHVLPWALVQGGEGMVSALSDIIAGLTKHLVRQSDEMTLRDCITKLKSAALEEMGQVRAKSFAMFLVALRGPVKLPPNFETQLRDLVQSIASKLARKLSHLLSSPERRDRTPFIELVQLHVILLQLLHDYNLPVPSPSIASELLNLAAQADEDRMSELSPLVIEITHAEVGGTYSEQTLATLTLLNALSPGIEASKAFASMMRLMYVDNFASALEGSISALASQRDSHKETEGLSPKRVTIGHLRTIQTLIGVPLQGSGKVVRRVCDHLQDVIARIVYEADFDETLAAIECLEQLILARSRILRPMDFATTCSILAAVLKPKPACQRASTSYHSIFDRVLIILSSIARLRADLIAECPAELIGVISSMFTLFFEPRRQYIFSARSRARVTSRWPPWLADPDPLGVSELRMKTGGLGATRAAQLARLLTGLCQAKLDQPRNSSRPGSSSIANSLVKHVPAILVAYCRAVGDPWGSISADVRKELEPGLWSMCEVLTAGGRVDARGREGEGLGLPFGLGEGGEVEKEVWAAMWLNWGKHRYQGKG